MMQDLKIRRVDENDTFQFQCSRCTQCCKNVYQSVMLNTYDIFRIAKHMDRQMEDIIMEYLEPVFITEHPIPVFMLKTIGTGKQATCVWLEKRKCRMQEVKPLVCRLYPLNIEPNRGLTSLNPCIVSQKKHHYTGKTHVVGDWLHENMDETDKTATLWWYKAAQEMGRILKNANSTASMQEWIATRAILLLYIFYDTDKDFLYQYAMNLNTLLKDFRAQVNQNN